MKQHKLCLVLVTTGSLQEARAVARAVLRAKLAACVNIVPRIESHYWWQGKIDKGGEFLLIIKTQRRKFQALARTVRATHSYQTPEVVALPVLRTEKNYAKWWRDSMG